MKIQLSFLSLRAEFGINNKPFSDQIEGESGGLDHVDSLLMSDFRGRNAVDLKNDVSI